MSAPPVSLADEVLLHVAGVTDGRTAGWHIELGRAVAGAVLIELALAHRIAVRPEGLTVLSLDRVADPVQDEVLGRLVLGRRGGAAQEWVERLAPRTLVRVEQSLRDRDLLVPVPPPGLLARPRLLPRHHRAPARAYPAGTLRALLTATREPWATGAEQPPHIGPFTPAPPDSLAAIPLVCAGIRASLAASAHQLVCRF
ncbi:GPP34 family phosphoprotein [Streptomyces sp. NPDC059819]|uniref:GOLPH3/VPS74 family protein n=1 Tax=Streptomyces sp. NPDC059819 TaxID=3346963 RepID=UPI003650D320